MLITAVIVRELLPALYEQASNWMGEAESAVQRASIERFQALLTLVATVLANILNLAQEISARMFDPEQDVKSLME